DGGGTWSSAGLDGESPRGLTVNGGTVYAGLNGSLLETDDGGATWQPVGTGPNVPDGDVVSDPADTSTLYVVGDGAVKSEFGGRLVRRSVQQRGRRSDLASGRDATEVHRGDRDRPARPEHAVRGSEQQRVLRERQVAEDRRRGRNVADDHGHPVGRAVASPRPANAEHRVRGNEPRPLPQSRRRRHMAARHHGVAGSERGVLQSFVRL